MPENVRVWVEVVFNVSYLVVIWGLVLRMTQRRGEVAEADRAVANRLRWAFALLALGDTGHVGFRVVAYALGGLEANPALVGLGALSTAYTVTLFYMLLVDVWRLRFQHSLGWFGWLLLAAGTVRMLVMAFPQNQWQLIVPPYDWSLLRNAFLVLQGLGVMALFFRDSARAGDRTFTAVAWMIALSFAFYTPVILWVGQLPLLGMLMIPKTCAYIAVAVIAYRALYPRRPTLATKPA
ncbi:hypothetical protein [Levilinea saccharolytica]|uniref:Uncharacterized protein n=1 Tax=Levilinea saccharolytica TaxID=229921 RepID=A0A0N8GN94_9CHLR|nr:hypothetical protein [Levilinea saccharolytica]KPL77466.1 hypothetical protein ADN01_16395 [Levilinea saccharolytica]GAP18840.1 hypothetical protein LSAC_02738 [Levilinea saccharolytica]